MKLIKPAKINGIVNAPASKSVMGRAVASALLTEGKTELINPSFCDDGLTALNIVETLGAQIIKKKKKIIIESKGIFKTIPKNKILTCNESGLCIRMFAPIVALSGKKFILNASGSLLKRPMKMLGALTQLGAKCEIPTNGYPPIKVIGPMCGGKIQIDGSESSQFLTGLLMVLPLCSENSTIKVLNLKSKPYIQMTISLLAHFGIEIENKNFKKFKIKGNQKYRSGMNYFVEGDWSGASFILVAGAIAGKIRVNGLNINSYQADKEILSALKKVGAKIKIGKNYINVEKNELNAFEFDASECPDLFPPLVVLAINCKGTTIIKGTERLKYKESDRANVLMQEFRKIGAKIKIIKNNMEITGTKLKGGKVNSHNDHRIAMACAIAALNSKNGISLSNPECVSKSYPEFFNDLDV